MLNKMLQIAIKTTEEGTVNMLLESKLGFRVPGIQGQRLHP